MTKWVQPHAVNHLDLAFGGDMAKLLPLMSEIPDEFKRHSNPWAHCASTWFCVGLKGAKFFVKDGIDQSAALAHVAAILRSFEPKHEHKEAAAAYLMSLWFDKVEFDGGSAA